jgi:EAL domain
LEATIMPILFWLALLLGYLTGVTAAVLLLPARLIEPLYGPLALTTVLVTGAFGVLLRLRRLRRVANADDAAPPPPPRTAARPADELDEPEADDEPGDELVRPEDRNDRWPLMVRLEPPGVIGPAELRHILYEARVDLRLRPIASLAQPEDAFYHALPRLRGADDQPLEPASWRTTAARSGLLGTLDRLLLLRCVEMLRASRSDDRRTTLVCDIALASLDDPGFVAELGQQLSEDPQIAESLVLALDQVPADRPAVAVAAGLRKRGVRFCLRRLGPPPNPVQPRAQGFEFLLLDAERFALRPQAGATDPALLELQKLFAAGGPRLLVARRGADSVTILGGRPRPAAQQAVDLARPSAA